MKSKQEHNHTNSLCMNTVHSKDESTNKAGPGVVEVLFREEEEENRRDSM
jgi:hypothetical protein